MNCGSIKQDVCFSIAGQERFRSLIPSYIRDSTVAVVVYDITSKIHNFICLAEGQVLIFFLWLK